MPEALIVTAVRTPIGRAVKGSLRDVRPDNLVATAIEAAVAKSGVDPALFASQVLAVSEAVGIDIDTQLNPAGGAIALGHPFGMTGIRLLCSLMDNLDDCGGRLGLATLCVGGGQGMAVLIERL